MTGIEARLLERVQVAETPLYSAYAWLGREFGRPLSLARFLVLVDELLAEDKLRLWAVDSDSFVRQRLDSIPRNLTDQYERVGGLDPSFDPFGLSLTLGDAVDPQEEPEWTLDLDFEREEFELAVDSSKEEEAFAQASQFFPDVRLVETRRTRRDHRTQIVGLLLARPPKSRTRSGGTGMSQVDSWQPTFPDPQPAHWLSVAAAGPDEVRILSDVTLDEAQRNWLARWLEMHTPREPDAEASYIYLGLAPGWSSRSPDGETAPDAVTGLGWGTGFGEPDGAAPSTVAELIRSACKAFGRGSP